MADFVAVLLLVAFCAVLNRFRGGGFGADRLPGHPRFYVAPFVLVLAWLALPFPAALAFAAGFLLWSWPPWGFLMCLGRWTPIGRPMSSLEWHLLAVSRGNLWLALGLRHLLIWPGLFGAAWFGAAPWLPVLALPFAGLAVGSYELGWRLRPGAPIELAEILTGAAWGALLLCAAL
jgi:hypothetical protein